MKCQVIPYVIHMYGNVGYGWVDHIKSTVREVIQDSSMSDIFELISCKCFLISHHKLLILAINWYQYLAML